MQHITVYIIISNYIYTLGPNKHAKLPVDIGKFLKWLILIMLI